MTCLWFLSTRKLHFPFSQTKVRRVQKEQFSCLKNTSSFILAVTNINAAIKTLGLQLIKLDKGYIIEEISSEKIYRRALCLPNFAK
jgi:hypothetical protein